MFQFTKEMVTIYSMSRFHLGEKEIHDSFKTAEKEPHQIALRPAKQIPEFLSFHESKNAPNENKNKNKKNQSFHSVGESVYYFPIPCETFYNNTTIRQAAF